MTDREISEAIAHLTQACRENSSGWLDDMSEFTRPAGNQYVVGGLPMIYANAVGHLLTNSGTLSEEQVEADLATAVIRICDLAGWFGFDFGEAIVRKLSEFSSSEPNQDASNPSQPVKQKGAGKPDSV